MTKARRLVKVSLSYDLIIQMLTSGWHAERITCMNGVPKDSEFIGSFTDLQSLTAWLVFQHPSFAVVLEGGKIPELEPPISFRQEYE